MTGFLRQMVGLCLVRLILDFALPEGDEGKCASLGAELTAMLCMLRALLTLLGKSA